jgi:eukaryotic-like serine/threonine-protein kinase
MVHRDIKPANLLVQQRGLDGEASGLIKISDFGLARLHHPDAPAGGNHYSTIHATENTVMGTPDYLAPEQSRSLHQADIRSDLYGLGCTFYYLLTGYAPFSGGGTIDKLIRHNTVPAPAVTTRRPDVPPDVAGMVARLLAKSPEQRFQTPAELAEALTPFSASGPVNWAAPISPSASIDDTLPFSRAKTMEARPEFDFTSDEVLEPGSPSTSAADEGASARRRTKQVEFFAKALQLVQKALGR